MLSRRRSLRHRGRVGPHLELLGEVERLAARVSGQSPVAASQPDNTHDRSERPSDSRSQCRRGPTFPSRRPDLPHRADGDGQLQSECSCRSAHTPCAARDWLRLGTAIPSAPSPSPRLGAVQPVRCDLPLDLYVRSLDAHGVSRNAAWGWRPEHCAGLDVVDGPMPRARDLLARYLALRERTAAVRAGVVNGVEAALDVEEGDLLPRHLATLGLARSEVGGARDLGELRHVNLLATRW